MAGPADTAGVGRDSTMPVGIWEGELTGAPHFRQKLLSSGTSLEHDGHFMVSPILAIDDENQILNQGTTRQNQPVGGRPVKIPYAVCREVR